MTPSEPPRSLQWSITPSIDFTNQTLTLAIKDSGNQITREVCHLKEKAIRAGLIALGWSPPDQLHEKPPVFREPLNTPETYAWPLWKHLHDDHGLILTESEMHEILRHAAPFVQSKAATQLAQAKTDIAELNTRLHTFNQDHLKTLSDLRAEHEKLKRRLEAAIAATTATATKS